MNSVGPVLCISSPTSCCVVAVELARQVTFKDLTLTLTLSSSKQTESVRNPKGNEQLYFALRFH